MKTIGLIGGLSWYSTAVYYKLINENLNRRVGGSASAKLILYSVDFSEFDMLQKTGNWAAIASMFIDIAQRLIVAGADAIMICSNTPHMIADQIAKLIDRPLIHIAEETAMEISKYKLKRVGLLGTRFTMEQSFFIEKLNLYGIEALVPEPEERTFVHQSIFNELSCGIYTEDTKDHYLHIIDQLKSQQIPGLIFGCSEISLLIDTDSLGIPVFDTTRIHAFAAVEFILS